MKNNLAIWSHWTGASYITKFCRKEFLNTFSMKKKTDVTATIFFNKNGKNFNENSKIR